MHFFLETGTRIRVTKNSKEVGHRQYFGNRKQYCWNVFLVFYGEWSFMVVYMFFKKEKINFEQNTTIKV